MAIHVKPSTKSLPGTPWLQVLGLGDSRLRFHFTKKVHKSQVARSLASVPSTTQTSHDDTHLFITEGSQDRSPNRGVGCGQESEGQS